MHTNFKRSRSARFILSSLLIVILGLAVLVAVPTPAEAADGTFYSTALRCWPGEYTYKVNVNGAFNGQWGAIRHHLWNWVPGSGWVYGGATGWEIEKLPGPNQMVVGGNITVRAPAGTYVALATDVAYWNGSSWGPVQSLKANHFQGRSSLAQSYCRT